MRADGLGQGVDVAEKGGWVRALTRTRQLTRLVLILEERVPLNAREV